MAIGTITSPATWLLGTVAAPAYLQNVEDNINGWIAGTGSTLCALEIDGLGSVATVLPKGLFLSKHTEISDNWPIAAQTFSTASNPLADLGKRWSYLQAGTAPRLVFNDPSATYPARSALLNSGGSVAADYACLSTAYPVMYGGLNFSLSFDAQVTAKTGTAQELHFGIGNNQLVNVVSTGVKFYLDHTLANWQVAVNGGANNDSGVAAVIGTWFRFRINVSGSTVKAYINEALVYTTTASMAGALYVGFMNKNPNTGTSTATIGQVKLLFTRT